MSRSSRLFSNVKNIFFYRLVRAIDSLIGTNDGLPSPNDSLPGANNGKASWAHSI